MWHNWPQGRRSHTFPPKRRKLYPPERYKDGHPDLANSLNNLAILYRDQGKLAVAEPLFQDALEMHKRLLVAYGRQK